MLYLPVLDGLVLRAADNLLVGQQEQTAHGARMSAHLLDQPLPLHVPQAYVGLLAGEAAHEQTMIGADREPLHAQHGPVLLYGEHGRQSAQVPLTDRLVLRAAKETASVGRQLDAAHGRRVALQRGHTLGARELPQLDRVVERAADDAHRRRLLLLGGVAHHQRQAEHALRVALERLHALLAEHVPQLDRLVARGAEQLTVAQQLHAVHVERVALERVHAPHRLEVPHLDGGVERAADEVRAHGQHLEAVYWSRVLLERVHALAARQLPHLDEEVGAGAEQARLVLAQHEAVDVGRVADESARTCRVLVDGPRSVYEAAEEALVDELAAAIAASAAIVGRRIDESGVAFVERELVALQQVDAQLDQIALRQAYLRLDLGAHVVHLGLGGGRRRRQRLTRPHLHAHLEQLVVDVVALVAVCGGRRGRRRCARRHGARRGRVGGGRGVRGVEQTAAVGRRGGRDAVGHALVPDDVELGEQLVGHPVDLLLEARALVLDVVAQQAKVGELEVPRTRGDHLVLVDERAQLVGQHDRPRQRLVAAVCRGGGGGSGSGSGARVTIEPFCRPLVAHFLLTVFVDLLQDLR